MNDCVERGFCDLLNRIHFANHEVGYSDNLLDVTEHGTPIRKLFISNLAERTTYKDLEALFSKYGNVESCFLRRNQGKSNFAFITFSNVWDALRAREDGWRKEIRLHNRDLRVMPADPWHQPDNIENQHYNIIRDSSKLDKKSCNELCEQTNIEIDNTNMSINRLNDDCLMHIFLYLPIVDRVKIERVCKRWRAVSQESWCAVKRLDLAHNTWGFPIGNRRCEIDTVTLRGALLRCGKFLNHISMAQAVHRLSKSTLTIIGKLCPNLQTIDVTALSVSASGIHSLTNNCQNIKRLSFSGSTCLDGDFIKLFQVNTKLEYLKIIANNISGKCLLHLPSDTIKEIVLLACDHIKSHYLSEAFAKFSNLQSLTINNCICVTNCEMETIGTHCKQLKSLEISGVFSLICANDLQHITNLVNLETLKVRRNEAVTDEFLDNLVSKCQQLTYIDMTECCHVTNAGVAAIATLPKLETLIINNLHDLTDECLYGIRNLKRLECRCCFFRDKSIMSIIEFSPNLELLDLSGCIYITNDTLDMAAACTDCRTNNIILKMFIGGTNAESRFVNVSPFLQVVNVDLSDCYNSNYSLITYKFDISDIY